MKKIVTMLLTLCCICSAVSFPSDSLKVFAYSDNDISQENYEYYLDDYDLYYTGKPLEPDVSVYSYNDWFYLDEGTDYTVRYSNNTNAGTANVIIQGIGEYTGIIKTTFEIQKVDISWGDADISLEGSHDYDYFYYTGSDVKPKIKAEYNGYVLKEGTDYSLSYSGNLKDCYEGATVIVTGKGNFEGSYKIGYYIEPREITSGNISLSSTYTYTGSEIRPVPVVKAGGRTLIKNTDYIIDYYENNINAGKGKVYICGIGGYYGDACGIFTIAPKTVTNLKVNLAKEYAYSGKAVCPKPKVYSGSTLLKLNRDYTLSYKNNINTGKAQCTVSSKGNYKWNAKTYNFDIKFGVINTLNSSSSSDKVTLSWDKVPLATGYKISKYDSKKKKWAALKNVSATKYSVSSLQSAAKYKFGVTPYRKLSNGKYQYGPMKTIDCTTKLKTPVITLKAYKNKANISWSKVPRASGYEIYCCGGEQIYNNSRNGVDIEMNSCYNNIHLVKTVSANTTSFTKTGLKSNFNYHFKIRAYYIVNGKKVYSSFSGCRGTASATSRLNAAPRKTHSSYKIVNTQKGGKTTSHTLTAKEKKILSNFAKTHFKSGWTTSQKVIYTADWIRKHMVYGKIPTNSHTENVFVKKQGQCTDYNGALVEMMTYLGYNVRLVGGNRYPTGGPHWWGEIDIDGTTYLLEAGETRYDSGSYYKWEFICLKYSEKQENSKYWKYKGTSKSQVL
ncbi:MAG: transglutaminase domain-containing protein [Oscillospiraceae bacterium]